MAKILHRNSRIIPREVETDIFLIDEVGGAIHHLNRTAAALWRLIETPAPRKDVLRQFRYLYPDEDAGRLDAALRAVIRDLSTGASC
ncbi:PqqD family protein [Maribius pontilimi]|uniref:PqqD family protein n=1 Tax=Palleronia pontilimi TaxID=1964209 RepID=A0A934M9K0_9RHOB|nr:PqqD family protein [Palleronia pontilimi]MBJ3762632.1 PqqD family protein [Palleronia pontilimi]